MNHKPLFISSTIVTLLAACALEGGGLSAGQAIAVVAPAGVLAVWSFAQTEWWEGGEEDAPREHAVRHER